MDKKQNDPWVPSNALEEEVVSLQPRYNFIFGNYWDEQDRYSAPPRPKEHLERADKQRKQEEKQKELLERLEPDQREKLSTIIKVQNVINTKPLGELPTVDDWNDGKQCERDTIAMMRKLHLEPSTELPLNSACTIGTVSAPEDYKIIVTKNGRIPVFLGENFFKLSPAPSEKEGSLASLDTNASPRTEPEEVSDLIKFSTTESSLNSTEVDDAEVSYHNLTNGSNCSAISESSYGYGPINAYPLSSYIREMPKKKSPRGKKAKNKN